jgi:hypothetical protein
VHVGDISSAQCMFSYTAMFSFSLMFSQRVYIFFFCYLVRHLPSTTPHFVTSYHDCFVLFFVFVCLLMIMIDADIVVVVVVVVVVYNC